VQAAANTKTDKEKYFLFCSYSKKQQQLLDKLYCQYHSNALFFALLWPPVGKRGVSSHLIAKLKT
jgi:hypothetical protein